MVLLPLVPLQSELIAYSILALRAKIYKPLAPSSFCKSSGWVRQQHGPAFINCLRPIERSGLPLNLLHPLFAEFTALIEGAPDYTDYNIIFAERAATVLCQEMPQAFDSEETRLEKFRDIVSPLFKDVVILDGIKIGSANADRGIREYNGLILVGEGRNEPGEGAGDPYMQIAASYDAWARLEDNPQTGSPCFLFCVDGKSVPSI